MSRHGAGNNGMRLAGKRVVVTGAAAGIGLAGVMLFLREGARVMAIDIDATALDRLPPDVLTHQADLTQPGTAAAAIDRAASLMGGLDVVWSHAGMNGPPRIEDADRAATDRVLALNLGAMIEVCAAASGRMVAGGSVVLTASVAGVVGSVQSPVYSASKHAVVGLAKSLALQWAARGIRVNAICPGPVDTPMMADLRAGRLHPDGPAMVDRLVASVPLGRLATPREITEAALWLASDSSSFVTGTALMVDGGVTAR